MDAQVVMLIALSAGIVLVLGVAVLGFRRTQRSRRPRVIRVVGVGGGGVSIVGAMIRSRLRGVDYVTVNTDRRELNSSAAPAKIAIGASVTNQQGAGGDPAVGEAAARADGEEIGRALAGSDLVVVVAGLGGGTGSGALPVVAEIARRQGAMTMAVLTIPFGFEGSRRRRVAEQAAAAAGRTVDAVATVPNDRVRELMPDDVTAEDAFKTIDGAICRIVSEILDLVAAPGRISLDFADVKVVLKNGAAAVGLGRASGDNRATEAARQALASTLLGQRLKSATAAIVNVSGSRNLRLTDLDVVSETILAAMARDAQLTFGMRLQPSLGTEVQVTLIATGFEPGAHLSAAADATAAGGTASPAWRPVWLRRADDAAGRRPGPMPAAERFPSLAEAAPAEAEAVTQDAKPADEVAESTEAEAAALETASPATEARDDAPEEASTDAEAEPMAGKSEAHLTRRQRRAAARAARAADETAATSSTSTSG